MTTGKPASDDQQNPQEHSWFEEMLNTVGNVAAQSSDAIAKNITSAIESISDAATHSGQAPSQTNWAVPSHDPTRLGELEHAESQKYRYSKVVQRFSTANYH